LIGFEQGVKMTKFDLNLIDSVLDVKASGSQNNDILNDLNLPQGKSIAQLLYEQKNQKIDQEDPTEPAQ